jgi:3-oxoacyl-[acyl-carrier protein] reductase
VHAFAKALARTLAPDRITVNVIAPGLTDTEMLRGAHPPEEIAEIAGRIPLGLGSVDDVAAAAVFLASDAGRQLTGVVLDVNGGMLMR